MSDDPVSWRAITAHCLVYASDGQDIGRLLEVAALPEEDIFHGIVFRHHGHGRNYLAPAADVGVITADAIHLLVDGEAAGRYEEFHEMHINRLGMTGLFFWKHLGWKPADE